ncbi:unnamed protein product [Acanthocheilonema viteae]|uniref:Uncharacterized protein n=1 Tax=Acanthocheilonema viteae TaxID=6277 RepID=A0A498SKI7_ACAVI|nr:unnamed protein product [Acanthocheilonema viteae]
MDQLDVKEVCSISGETFSSSSEDDDGSKKLKRTKRELRAEHAAKYERDRMSMVMPDPVRDRERERNFVHLATKKMLDYRGVVQLFNAVAERQKELSDVSAANMTSKKRRLRGISAESFRRKLAESRIVKDGVDDTKDWLSDDQVAIKSETEDDLNTSEIKTEVESNSE